MSTLVTLDVFSGRPNPRWLLDEEQTRELQERLGGYRERTTDKPSGGAGRLGYRGFHLQPAPGSPGTGSIHVHEGLIDPGGGELTVAADDAEIESFLLATVRTEIDERVLEHVRAAIDERYVLDRYRIPEGDGCPPCNAADAPTYEPGLWNVPSVQPHNNCYNYANDRITNTFAQPGRAHGQMYTGLSCKQVRPAAEADGLTASSNFSDRLKTCEGWYVALVIWPAVDYHWYRQDENGCWSHKAGGTAARNTDESGNVITDPKTADRGNYTDFCTYMITNSRITIR